MIMLEFVGFVGILWAACHSALIMLAILRAGPIDVLANARQPGQMRAWLSVGQTRAKRLPAPAAAIAATAVIATAVATTTATAAPTAVAAATTATTVAAGRPRLRLEAVVAIDGAITAGLERHFGLLATRTARSAEHFAAATAAAAIAATTATFASATGGPAVRATAGFIREPLGLMKLLFTRCESERTPTVRTGKGFVGERHATTSKDFQDFLRSSSTSTNGRQMERG